MSFITTDDPREYALHMSKDVREKNYDTNSLNRIKGISEPILEIVKEMLMFNPYFRASGSEIL